jgi:hypothetical protein
MTKKKMALKIEDLLEDIRKVRNDLVAQANPHFQSLTNIIYKWETKLVQETPEYKLKMFKEREQEERENLERISREAIEEEKYGLYVG